MTDKIIEIDIIPTCFRCNQEAVEITTRNNYEIFKCLKCSSFVRKDRAICKICFNPVFFSATKEEEKFAILFCSNPKCPSYSIKQGKTNKEIIIYREKYSIFKINSNSYWVLRPNSTNIGTLDTRIEKNNLLHKFISNILIQNNKEDYLITSDSILFPESDLKLCSCLYCKQPPTVNKTNNEIYYINCKHFDKSNCFNRQQIYNTCPDCKSSLEVIKDTDNQLLFFCSNKKCNGYCRIIENGKINENIYTFNTIMNNKNIRKRFCIN